MLYEKVVAYCKENKISLCAFEKMCGIGNGVISAWENDQSTPNLKSLQKISDATGISLSDLLSESKNGDG